jgi:3-(3-hydroxy-phenyl)propionate hydroxylase
MCSGLRDASNLAWKLDHVLRHGAPVSLLDTYGAERSVHVREIVEAAIAFGRVICITEPGAAAERDHRMLAHATEVSTGMAMSFALPSLHPGELILERGGELFVQPQSDDGQRLDDLVGQRFAILARTEASLATLRDWWVTELDAFVAVLADVPSIAAALGQWLDARSADVVVVRPDRYVMWAGRDLEAASASVGELLAGPAAKAIGSKQVKIQVGQSR